MQRLESDDHLNRGAIRVGDDPLRNPAQRVGVHFGHDERHVGVHAPGAGVVDNDGPGLGGDRAVFPADGSRRARQDDIDAGKRFGPDWFDVVRFALEVDRFARAAFGGEELDRPHGKLVLAEHLPHYRADRAGRAHHRNARQHEQAPFQ